MPITKTISIKSENNLTRAIHYILNPDKTEEQVLTSGYKINNLNNADFEMNLTRFLARQVSGNSKAAKDEVFARHIIQSFAPEDNLTPEEIHEIGRQTVLELTGGNHEFVIATHIDKEHIHNHIIFNSTSTVDFKKFRWQKGTANLLRNISDQQADYAGAKILKQAKRNSHKKYQQWRNKNNYRVELKERLDFLMKYSLDLQDFKIKARLLKIEIDDNGNSKDYGQFIRYKLLDEPQERPARDYTMSKKQRKYSFEKIEERLTHNKVVYSTSEIGSEFEKIKKENKEVPDLKLTLEPWQIEKDTLTGIYVRLDIGQSKTGVIKIPDYKIDALDNGHYEIFINHKDFFYFLDEKNKPKSKFIKGTNVIGQLSDDSRRYPVRKNSAMQNVREMVAALNLLSKRHLQGEAALEALGGVFIEQLQSTEKSLEILNEKMSDLTEKVKFNRHNIGQVNLLKSLQEEHSELKNSYEEVLNQIEIVENIKSSVRDLDEKAEQERLN